MLPSHLNGHMTHATRRWVDAVFALVDSDVDVRTVGEWGRIVGASDSVMRSICTMQGVTPKPSLTFSRVLRLIVRREVDLIWQCLDVDDPRTVRDIITMAGLTVSTGPVTVEHFLACQRYIVNTHCCEAVSALWSGRRGRQ